MSDDLRSQVRNNLDIKETDELLAIWQANDRAAWTGMTFELLEEILQERLGEVPPQDSLPAEMPGGANVKRESAGLAAWEEKLLADDNQPEFYDPVEVVSLVNTIDKVALAAVGLNVFVGLSTFGMFRDVFEGFFRFTENGLVSVLSFFFNIFFVVVSIGLGIVVTYFPLKALAHILRILAEMEYNSRKT